MPEKFLDSSPKPIEYSTEDLRDLGFGSVVAGQSRRRLLNPDGSFNVERTGLSLTTSLNLYHTLLTMRWKVFMLLLLGLYFFSNVVFGLVYASLGADGLMDASADPTANPYIREFFFSVQTFATIGYGTIHPVGILPNMIVAVESYYSLIANALITGLVFARFARPTAKIVFSDMAVIAPHRGGFGLMFRLVNGRSNQLAEVRAQVMFARFVDVDGKPTRRFDNLALERSSVTFFPLAWTVVHPIDERSPFFGLTESDLRKTDAELLILLSAHDETFSQVVQTRSSFKPDAIRFGYRFKNIYNETREGEPISIDVRKLSQIERA